MKLSLSSDLPSVPALMACSQGSTLGVQGVNACFRQDMQSERTWPKSGGWELPFELSDFFLDNTMYTQ
jgi:hypothetical protein